MISQFFAGARSLAILPRRALTAALLTSILALTGCAPVQTQGQSAATASPNSNPVPIGGPSVSLSVSPATTAVDIGSAPTTFTVTIADPSALGVTWQVNGTTGGNSTTGTITASGVYTPPSALPVPATVTVTAVSVADPTQSASATVTLREPSALPTITVTPGTATVAANGGTQVFLATVTGSSNSTVTWLVNDVAGGNADVGTITTAGLYSAPAVVPASGSVTVKAIAAVDPAVSAAVTVAIIGGAASGPVLSGTPPASVQAGHPYLFQPIATTKSGGSLTFSVSNKPAWASFDTKTGALSGTPASTDQGTYSNVVISVSDGVATASLPPFTITVQAATTGSVTLSWVAPTQRTDGSPLTNLAGFRVYYGTALGIYQNSISVPNPGLTTYVVPSLPSGTYYFVATAYDASGAESAYSDVASKTIN